MNQHTRARGVTREATLDLLSDDEAAKVSSAEVAVLHEGDAVLDGTWRAILQPSRTPSTSPGASP